MIVPGTLSVMADETPKTVTMTVREWQYIDAVIDNTVSIAAVDGPREHVDQGQAVRQAGWDQLVPDGGDWPPDDEEARVTLSPAQWHFVAQQLDEWADVEDEDLDGDSGPLRRIREHVLTQLQS